jgi:glycerophosphoryl diester phosphodiesterase
VAPKASRHSARTGAQRAEAEGLTIKSMSLTHSLLSRPLVYAHRGGAALRPENTLGAFDHGLTLGADGLELDVHLSHDGVVVVHHDDTLDRTTNARGRIGALTAADLAQVDAGYRFSLTEGVFPYRSQGWGVPTLRQVLSRYPVPLIVELKTPNPALARATVEEIRAARALDRVALGSFYYRALREVRELEPRLATGAAQEETRWALYRSWVRWPVREPAYREFQVPERSGPTTIVTPRFVALAHDAGLLVKVWTVNQRHDIDRLLDWGVDAIISDRPDIAVAARDRAYPK